MAWPASRFRTYVNGSSLTPSQLNAIQDRYLRAGGIGPDDLHADLAKFMGLNQGADAVAGVSKRRGLSYVPQEQSFSPPNATPVKATTPDVVEGIVAGANDLMIVRAWLGAKQAGTTSSKVWIYLDESKVNVTNGLTGATEQIGITISGADYNSISTTDTFLASYVYADPPVGKAWVLSAISAQNPLVIHPGAGTWDVSLRYESGTPPNATISVKQRRLYVEMLAFS